LDRDFEWDPDKAARNLLKHDISFPEAAGVFDDPKAMIMQDSRFNYGERRDRIVGKLGDDRMVAVIYTERSGLYRLLSARKANSRERREYDSRQSP